MHLISNGLNGVNIRFWYQNSRLWLYYRILCSFFDCDSLHAKLNRHYKAHWYKKKEHKKIKAYSKSLYKEHIFNRCVLILDLKLLKSKVKGKHSIGREFQSLASCAGKETVDIDILVTSRNGDRKVMQSITITSRPPTRKRKWNQLNQFWRTSTKVIPTEKT